MFDWFLNTPQSKRRKEIEKKKLWLLSFFMAVAPCCYYEKVRRPMRLTIVLCLFNIYIYIYIYIYYIIHIILYIYIYTHTHTHTHTHIHPK